MPKFAAGVVHFQNDVYPKKKELFEKLSKGQSPEALFITCSDSRIETAMITQTDPGELFICRNAGNIVPPHTTATGGMTASIEFAVAALQVPHIVICGHTECGAMKGAMNIAGLDALCLDGVFLHQHDGPPRIRAISAIIVDTEGFFRPAG